MRPPVIGILGAVAAGKSSVARLAAARGAKVIDADRIGHEVLDEPDVRRQIEARFGQQAMDGNGAVSRSRLGKIVFENADALRDLNAITHPRILKRIKEQIEALRAEGAPAIVLDAALLVECNLQPLCDVLVFVEAPPAARSERAGRDRGWSPDETARRERFQADPEAKKRLAHWVIANKGTWQDLESEFDRFWKKFVPDAKK